MTPTSFSEAIMATLAGTPISEPSIRTALAELADGLVGRARMAWPAGWRSTYHHPSDFSIDPMPPRDTPDWRQAMTELRERLERIGT